MKQVLPEISDGLDALRKEIGVREIVSLIERTARWVSPDTFKLLPLWYPEYARKVPLYNASWSEPRMNKNRRSGHSSPKFEGNTQANQALTLALGLRKKLRPNWTCCHIWGVDDQTFQLSNDVVQDHRFFSCVGNMVLLPTPLKAFTDTMPEVKAMLRICARNLYGWQCDHESVMGINETLDRGIDWKAYPESWPRNSEDKKLPRGVAPLTSIVEASVVRRKATIRRDLEQAGDYYPRQKVQEALAYWKIML